MRRVGVRAVAASIAGLAACTFGSQAGTGSGSIADDDGGNTVAATGAADTGPGDDGLPTTDAGDDTPDASDDGPASGGPAGSTSAGDGDTSGDPPPSGPFGPPALVEELSHPDFDDDDPTLRQDLLEIFFDSNRGGTSDIWTATRDSPDAPWDGPHRVPGINDQGSADSTPELTLDGLALFFTSDRPGSQNGDVYVSLRDSIDDPWQAPSRVDALSSPDPDIGPTPVAGRGNPLYLCSGRPEGVGNLDVWLGSADPLAGVYGDLALVSEWSTPDNDCTLALRNDGLEVFLETQRDGGPGDWDLWTATREAPDARFPALAPAAELNTETADTDPWLSPDGTILYMASTRLGTSDLFVAVR